MRAISSAVLLAGLFGGSLYMSGGQTLPRAAAGEIIDTYCSACHNGSMRSASGAVLDRLDAAHIAETPDLWARAYRQLQAGTMPPFGAPRPDRGAVAAALASIEQALESRPGTAAATSQEIAEQLASLLWNGQPDVALLQDAQRNLLVEPAVLERHVGRMLADEKAQAFVSRFFFPWLALDKLSTADPDTTIFPDYDTGLRDAFLKETELFLLSQLRDDRDPVELWEANYTYLNERLAKHYGIPDVAGAQFRKVALSSPERAGLLGQASVLMATSRHGRNPQSAYTSPAARSTWIRMHFLGAPAPQPAPNAAPVRPDLPITPQTRTLPAQPCLACHVNFFPLGYALENFDPIGRWRTEDQVGPVDASGAFVDGTPTNGVVELRKVLLQRPEAFRTTVTENLLIFASRKSVGPNRTSPETLTRARRILQGMKTPRWTALIAGVVREKPVQ